jgi:DNA-directed RNA polymerase subunit L
MSAKYFSDIILGDREVHLGPPIDFFVRTKNITLGATIMNSLRRSIMADIPTYTINSETIRYEINTSDWDPELISHHLSQLYMYNNYLEKIDINMMELFLNVENDGKTNKFIFAKEFKLRDKETEQIKDVSNIFVYPQTPIFSLAPEQKVELVCSIEKTSRIFAKRNNMLYSSSHQCATAGIDYLEDLKDPSKDPVEIILTVKILSGIGAKELIHAGFDCLLDRLKFMREAIQNEKSDKFYIKLNKYYRYDFVFLNEDHTIGNLIEKWINRHDPKSVAGYRENKDQHFITIDFGLFKLFPPVLQDKITPEIEEVMEESIATITSSENQDVKENKKNQEETVKVFLENILRIENYLRELKNDWSKVNITLLSTEKYNEQIFNLREQRKNE